MNKETSGVPNVHQIYPVGRNITEWRALSSYNIPQIDGRQVTGKDCNLVNLL
jgi:hypothetical protein